MMQKTIILVAVVALAAGAAAWDWKQCGQSNALIKNFEVPDCDPNIKERCALPVYANFHMNVDFVQKNAFNRPMIAVSYGKGHGGAGIGCASGLQCPGQAGQVQHLRHLASLSEFPRGSTNITVELLVRETNARGPQPEEICIEFPVHLLQ